MSEKMPIESVTNRTVPIDCQRSTSGGKGNLGMFIERDHKICAAGIPSAQPDRRVADCLQHYLLKDEADALISDAIIPPPKPRPLPPLRKPRPLDSRNAGPLTDVAKLINPPTSTKFQTLVNDFKETSYRSYWKTPLGHVQDPSPMLPNGFDIAATTFGKETPFHGRLYDIVMPNEPLPDATPPERLPGAQKNRNFCKPAYNPDVFYGCRSYVDKRGRYARCCLTDDRIITGNANITVMNSIQANFQESNKSKIGIPLTPNDNIMEVPEGHSFGKLKRLDNVAECLVYCGINPQQNLIRKCFAHLNSVRKFMSSRFLPTIYHSLYRSLKFFDKDKTGWLPKDVVYNYFGTKLIRLDTAMIEHLLTLLDAFDGTQLQYKMLLHILNYTEHFPDIPKIPDLPDDCLDYRTTYTEMVKPGQKADESFMAGLPSGRYIDRDYPITPERYCKAHRVCLVQESDAKSCLNPSMLTQMHVSHRDMYQAREPYVVKRVFEATGEKFSDKRFDTIWKEAQKYHTEGIVCYETFRKALIKSLNDKSETKEQY